VVIAKGRAATVSDGAHGGECASPGPVRGMGLMFVGFMGLHAAACLPTPTREGEREQPGFRAWQLTCGGKG
jgi:hypothetical protein